MQAALESAKENAAASQKHLRDQVDELKALIALQRTERHAFSSHDLSKEFASHRQAM